MVGQPDGGGQACRNWGLLLVIGLCVEFWIVAATFVEEIAANI
jgi:hypothetical protein